MRMRSIVLVGLGFIVAAGTMIYVYGNERRKSTYESIDEQQQTLLTVVADMISVGVSSDPPSFEPIERTFSRLERYSTLSGAVIYDDLGTPIRSLPEGYVLPPDLEEKLAPGSFVHEGIKYQIGVLNDTKGNDVGKVDAANLVEFHGPLRNGLIQSL